MPNSTLKLGPGAKASPSAEPSRTKQTECVEVCCSALQRACVWSSVVQFIPRPRPAHIYFVDKRLAFDHFFEALTHGHGRFYQPEIQPNADRLA